VPIKSFPSSEYELLHSLKPFLNFRKSHRYPIGIGDDAAIRACSEKENLILTADSFVEDVHFSFSYMTSADIGYKAMAINLSDCAAMGAMPDGALVQEMGISDHRRKPCQGTMLDHRHHAHRKVGKEKQVTQTDRSKKQ
jgi:selenophosphate synthetase-related protein